MNFAEMIKKLQAERQQCADSMEALLKVCGDEQRAFNDDENSAFEGAKKKIESIDQRINTLVEAEKLLSKKAVPVAGSQSQTDPAQRQGGAGGAIPHMDVKRNAPKGRVFTRYAMALAASKGNLPMAAELAKTHFSKDTPEVETILRAAVSAGSTAAGNWAVNLAPYQNAAGEFIELLRPQTVLGRMNGIRPVPFNVNIPRQTAGATVGWVGEAAPKPVSSLGFDQVTMPHTKVAGIVVITMELARLSDPNAEELVRRDMVDTIAQFTDQQFLDPAVTAVAGIRPASITNGITASTAASGATVAAIMADLGGAMLGIGANVPLQNLYWVMNPRTALSLSMLRTAQDVFAFPGMQNAQRNLLGVPVLETTGIPLVSDGGTPATMEGVIVLVAANEILMADDGQVAIDVSTEAAVAMATDGTGALTSLWQNNLIGIRAERMMHWLRRRGDAGVAVITGVPY